MRWYVRKINEGETQLQETRTTAQRKNPRKWVCEQKEKKGWKSTSGVVPIILISSIISIAIEIFIRTRPTKEALQDSTLCSCQSGKNFMSRIWEEIVPFSIKILRRVTTIAVPVSCPVSQLQASQSGNSCHLAPDLLNVKGHFLISCSVQLSVAAPRCCQLAD